MRVTQIRCIAGCSIRTGMIRQRRVIFFFIFLLVQRLFKNHFFTHTHTLFSSVANNKFEIQQNEGGICSDERYTQQGPSPVVPAQLGGDFFFNFFQFSIFLSIFNFSCPQWGIGLDEVGPVCVFFFEPGFFFFLEEKKGIRFEKRNTTKFLGA